MSLLDYISRTEQPNRTEIEATFGPMNVYVSGDGQEAVQETFDHVWEEMMDTSEVMNERRREESDGEDVSPGQAFG